MSASSCEETRQLGFFDDEFDQLREMIFGQISDGIVSEQQEGGGSMGAIARDKPPQQ